jgi:tetratricopeptide (TPR) repeat protein
MRADLLDLAILGTHLSVRLAPPDEVNARRRHALQILDEAEAILGISCVLFRERNVHARVLGLTKIAETAAEQADTLVPQTAWEYCALGLVYFRAEDYRRAASEFEHALELEPDNLWANFYRGVCACRLGRFEEASTAFSICVALASQCAWCYANRGLAETERGRLDLALRDFSLALRLDPTVSAALLGRSILFCRLERYDEALDDFKRASKLGISKAVLLYHRALIHLDRQERADAVRCLQSALHEDAGQQQARELLSHLQQQR